jgi:hypothetical protein
MAEPKAYIPHYNWPVPSGNTAPPDVPKWLTALRDAADAEVYRVDVAQALLATKSSPTFTGTVDATAASVRVRTAAANNEPVGLAQATALAGANRAHWNLGAQAINTTSTLVNQYATVTDPGNWLTGNGTSTAKVVPKTAGVYIVNLVYRYAPHAAIDKSARFLRLYYNGSLVAEDIREPGWANFDTVCQIDYSAVFNGTTDNIHIGALAYTNIDGPTTGSTSTSGRLILTRVGPAV